MGNTPRAKHTTATHCDYEKYADEDAPVIDERLAMARGEERLQPLHLLIHQPEQLDLPHPY